MPYATRGGEGSLKSEPLSCGLTTHLRVAGNFGSRGRTLCGFSTAISCHLPSTSSTSIVKGCCLVFRGPEERGSLSREEIVFPPRGRKFSCRARRVSCVNGGAAEEGGYCIVGCISGCVGGLRRGLISG